MDRLTERDEDGYIHIIYKCSLVDCYNKLGKLEDIEQELGIPLEVLFKALKYGIYYFNYRYDEARYSRFPQFYSNEFHGWVLHDGVYSTLLKIKDYGKTWALTREELENV